MDRHFRLSDSSENMPVLLALIGIWHNQICGFPSRAVLPYDQRLDRLSAYLQQLEMESNGKSVSLDGQRLKTQSAPVVWGEPGTNGQHAFYQMLHQGTRRVHCEFIVGVNGHEPNLSHHQDILLANCLAQSRALLKGRSYDDVLAAGKNSSITTFQSDRIARHRVLEGNRPSTTLIYPSLTPEVLGKLIALYEHRVFVEGVILGINSFDQWGVEFGKELSRSLSQVISNADDAVATDGSTRLLLNYIRRVRGN